MRDLAGALLSLALLTGVCRAADFDRPYILGTQVIEEGRLAEMLPELRKYGATQSRVGACWFVIERERGQEYDFANVDREVDLHIDNGFSVVLNLATVPLWASEAPAEAVRILKGRKHENLVGTFMVSPNRMDDYIRWVEAVAERYHDRVDFYEIWNEPDGMAGPVVEYDDNGKVTGVRYGGDPREFTRVLKAAYAVLHRLDPGCTVVACSLESKTAFLEGIYRAGGKGFFDAVSIHAYGEPLNRKWIQEIRDCMVAHGDGGKGILITEYGWGFWDKPGMLQEAIRWGRENEYIAAMHVHLGNYLFLNRKKGAGPLKPTPGLLALKQVSAERGPASSRSYAFEGDLPIEWRVWTDDKDSAELLSATDLAHGGRQSLKGSTRGTKVHLVANCYVRAKNGTLSFWHLVQSAEASVVKFAIVIAPAAPIFGADRSVEFTIDGESLGKWRRYEVRLADIAPTLADRTIMNVTLAAESGAPGLTVHVDDFSIAPAE
jgi:hypothetical protein